MDFKDTLGIKIAEREVPAATLMFIKKETGLPLSTIKSRVAKGDYLFVCEFTDDDGLRFINLFKRKLSDEFGVTPRLFEDGREEPSELFDNLEAQSRELDRQMGYEEGELLRGWTESVY